MKGCPPSAGYRLRKFGREHRVAVVIASAFASLMLAAATISIAMSLRATHGELQARRERNRALAAETQARLDGDESAAVLSFVQEHVLAAARPQGEEAQQANLGPNSLDIRQARLGLMRRLYQLGLFDRALPLYRDYYRSCLDEHGPRHVDTLLAMRDLAEINAQLGRFADAEPLFLDALAGLENRPNDDPIVVMTETYLANMYVAQGRYTHAEPNFATTSTLPANNLDPPTPVRPDRWLSLRSACFNNGSGSRLNRFCAMPGHSRAGSAGRLGDLRHPQPGW